MELDGRFNLAVDQGAAFDRKFVWRRGTGTPVNLTGRTAALEVVSRDGGAPLLSLTQVDGITLGGAAGTIAVHIDAADTAALEPTGPHPLLFQLTVTGGSPSRVARIASGFLTVSAQGGRGRGIERIVDRKDAVIEVADTPDMFTGSFLDGYIPLWSEAQGAFVMTEPAAGGDGGVALAAHVAAADPHTGYQRESEKGSANGYAALDGGGVVPDAQLPAALARDTEVTAAVAAEVSARDAAIAAHAAAADPHTGYQRESEKGSANGYAALDGGGVVPDAQLPSAIARDSEVTSAVAAEASARDAAIAAAVAALINSAPGALDTLEELADALGDDANFAATMTAALAGKQPLDADLTAIAAVAGQTSFGQALLAIADAAALRTAGGLVIGTNVAPAAVPGTSLPGSPANGDEYTLTDSTTAPTYEWHLRYHSTADKWYPAGGGWGFGTAFPSVAAKVDRVPFTLTDSLTAPTFQWSFVYNAGESTANKWEFVGGAPAEAEVATLESTTSATFTALTTAGPSVTVPRAGVYLISFGNTCDTGTIGTAIAEMAIKIGGAAAIAANATYQRNADLVSVARTMRQTCAANDVLLAQYASNGSVTVRFQSRWLSVIPVRVI